MQAYYEIETDITANHQLHIQLPDSIPQGRAKIKVIYEVEENTKRKFEDTPAFNMWKDRNDMTDVGGVCCSIKKAKITRCLCHAVALQQL
ncbi:MAG: hypothetical protein Q8Q50_12325 [Methylobacter sp.]|nr:hypothetical protein [Methylobacter sp.]